MDLKIWSLYEKQRSWEQLKAIIYTKNGTSCHTGHPIDMTYAAFRPYTTCLYLQTKP